MKRKVYNELLRWKNNKDIMPLMLLGVRQCGKTYIIREFCKKEFTDFVEINLLERTDIVDLYNSNKTSDIKYEELELILGKKLNVPGTVLFIDEIQESGSLISELKYFCEKHNDVRIICAGILLEVSLRKFKKSYPVGKVTTINMYPMDFEEFLIALGYDMLVSKIKECYKSLKPMGTQVHDKLIRLYKYYNIIGGMPNYVKNFRDVSADFMLLNKTILEDIKNDYFNDFEKFVENKSETLKIQSIYMSTPSQLTNESNKFQYSKVKSGGRKSEFESSIDWLKKANLINTSYRVSTPEIPLEAFKDNEFFKLFISDVGILNNMLGLRETLVLNDNLSLYKGALAENYVANQLIVNDYKLYYWQSDGQAEIDFLLYTNDGVIPMEVKASDNTQSKSLKVYMSKYEPKYAIRVSTKNFGYNDQTKIKSIPLYAVFCINE